MPIKMWIGSNDLAYYPAVGGYYRHGDLVDVPDEVLAADPDRWADAPKEPKGGSQGKNPDPEG